MKIQKVDKDFLMTLLDSEENYKFTPLGFYYAPENKGFTAIDNSTGDAWTEHFPTEQEALDYLNRIDADTSGEDPTDLQEMEQNIRLEVGKLDAVAGNLIEQIEDAYGPIVTNELLNDFKDTLNGLQYDITELQERMGWI